MYFPKKIIGLFLILILILILIPVLVFLLKISQKPRTEVLPTNTVISVSPTLAPFTTYIRPKLKKSDRYDVYLIGDSMTHAFGPRGGIFSDLLTQANPGTFFEVSNYAQANQSILLLPKRLNEEVQVDHDILLKPIMSADPTPDVIIIESFGYNPLSQLGIVPGLEKQEEVLMQVMTTLTRKYPKAVIVFMATIAPDKKTYGMSVTGSDADGRRQQAEERAIYIKKHIEYAREHNIPLINAYDESLDSTGDGDTIYINPDDDIHPSAEGLAFMARIMVRRIQEEKILP